MNSRPFRNPFDLLIISGIGVFFCDHNIELQDRSQWELGSPPKLFGQEFRDFLLHAFLNSIQVVIIENVNHVL